MAYKVKHLDGSAAFERSRVLLNDHHKAREWLHHVDPAVAAFHKSLPDYGETNLHNLPTIAAELGFRNVFVKDESTRFKLPAFKILGASWAIHQAMCSRLGLPRITPLAALIDALKGSSALRLVTCTEGNWGRACARMGTYLALPVTIYVPWFMNEYTQGLLREEGADVKLVERGSYDDAIAAVREDSQRTGAIMVMDTSWEGYTEVPNWVTEGYSTMLVEADRQIAEQTDGLHANLAFASVGVGSWAHCVVAHYKFIDAENKIVTVEPDVSASLKESLHCGRIVSIETGETIMNGMNCGTPSLIAWPVLRDGTWAAVTVTDQEAHQCVKWLQAQGVNAGPCGAATLAALKRLSVEMPADQREQTVVILFSTEGVRQYEVPI